MAVAMVLFVFFRLNIGVTERPVVLPPGAPLEPDTPGVQRTYNVLGEFGKGFSRYDQGFGDWEAAHFLFAQRPATLHMGSLHEVHFSDMSDHLFNPSLALCPPELRAVYPRAAYLATMRYQSAYNLASRCEVYEYTRKAPEAQPLPFPQRFVYVLDERLGLLARAKVVMPPVRTEVGRVCNESAFVDPHLVVAGASLIGRSVRVELYVSFLCRMYNPRRNDHIGPYRSVFTRLWLSAAADGAAAAPAAELDLDSSFIYEGLDGELAKAFSGRNHVFFWPGGVRPPPSARLASLGAISHVSPLVTAEIVLHKTQRSTVRALSGWSGSGAGGGGGTHRHYEFHMSGGLLLPFDMEPPNGPRCLLGLIHRHLEPRPKYVHAFFCLSIEQPHSIVALSTEFCFASPQRNTTCEDIQFASAPLQAAGDGSDDVLVPYGVNDCLARVLRLRGSTVRDMLISGGEAEMRRAVEARNVVEDVAKQRREEARAKAKAAAAAAAAPAKK